MSEIDTRLKWSRDELQPRSLGSEGIFDPFDRSLAALIGVDGHDVEPHDGVCKLRSFGDIQRSRSNQLALLVDVDRYPRPSE